MTRGDLKTVQCEVVVHEKERHDAIRVANMGFACRLGWEYSNNPHTCSRHAGCHERSDMNDRPVLPSMGKENQSW